jgi:hypothetical protein
MSRASFGGLHAMSMAQTSPKGPKVQNLSNASQTCAFYFVMQIFLRDFSSETYTAFLSLLGAIDSENVKNEKVTTDINKLSEKLSELVGPEVIETLKQNRNERGEVWCCCTQMS